MIMLSSRPTVAFTQEASFRIVKGKEYAYLILFPKCVQPELQTAWTIVQLVHFGNSMAYNLHFTVITPQSMPMP